MILISDPEFVGQFPLNASSLISVFISFISELNLSVY